MSETLLEINNLVGEVTRLKKTSTGGLRFEDLVGNAPAMRSVIAMGERGAATCVADNEHGLFNLLAPEAREKQVIEQETGGVEQVLERHQDQQPKQRSPPSLPALQRPAEQSFPA